MLSKGQCHEDTAAGFSSDCHPLMSSLFPMDLPSFSQIIPRHLHQVLFSSHTYALIQGFLGSQIRILRYVRSLPLFPLPTHKICCITKPYHFYSNLHSPLAPWLHLILVLLLPVTIAQALICFNLEQLQKNSNIWHI